VMLGLISAFRRRRHPRHRLRKMVGIRAFFRTINRSA
jgi:hypothetical protein